MDKDNNLSLPSLSTSSLQNHEEGSKNHQQLVLNQIVEGAEDEDPIQLLYKGKKYDWNSKVHIHVHMIEHMNVDAIEIVAYNTSNFVESDNIFINASSLYHKVEEQAARDRVEAVFEEYRRLKMIPPSYLTTLEWIKKNWIANYVLEHLVIQMPNNKLFIDVRDSDKNFRISHRLSSLQKFHDEAMHKLKSFHNNQSPSGNNSRRNSEANTPTTESPQISPRNSGIGKKGLNLLDRPKKNSLTYIEERSLVIQKPELANLSSIRRFGKSTTLLGELENIPVSKEEENLMKIIQNLPPTTTAPVSSSNNDSRRGSKSTNNKAGNVHRGGDLSLLLYNFQKFKNDLTILEESLSFLHISDFVILQLVCRKWHQALQHGVKNFTSFYLTSREDFFGIHPNSANNSNRNDSATTLSFLKQKIWKTMHEHHFESSDHTKQDNSNNNNNNDVNNALLSSPMKVGQLQRMTSFQPALLSTSHNIGNKEGKKPVDDAITVAKLTSQNANYFELPEEIKDVYRYKTDEVPIVHHTDTLGPGATPVQQLKSPQPPSRSVPSSAKNQHHNPARKPSRHFFPSSSSAKSLLPIPSKEGPEEVQDEHIRRTFVLPETLNRLFQLSFLLIRDLTLNYVIINKEFLDSLEKLSGHLERLSLGIIKVIEYRKAPETEEKSPTKTATNAATTAEEHESPNRRSTQANITSPQHPPPPSSSNPSSRRNSRNSSLHGHHPHHPHRSHHPSYDIQSFRYLNADDVRTILYNCGSELISLELSITIGELPSDIFQFTPKLEKFHILHTMISYECESIHSEIDGSMPIQEYTNYMTGITLPELLFYFSDNPHEALMLLDKRGKVIVVNEIFEKLFHYDRVKIFGLNHISFLIGKLTNQRIYENFQESLKRQLKNEEFLLTLYTSDGFPILIQMFFLPNLTKYSGLPLTANCLSEEFLTDLAFDHFGYDVKNNKENKKDLLTSKSPKGSKNNTYNNKSPNRNPRKITMSPAQPGQGLRSSREWKIHYKDFSFHLIRFGVLSQPILPYYNLQEA